MEYPEPGDQRASHHGPGIDEVLQVIQRLSAVKIISCVVGGHALRYFGAARAPEDWYLCVPNNSFEKAVSVISEAKDMYKPGVKCVPQLRSLIHTYPRFKQIGVDFSFYIVPHFEYFIFDFNQNMFEYSKNSVPYPRLQHYAQSLLTTQRWSELVHLIDGMDLDKQWGHDNLIMGLPTTPEQEYVNIKNDKIMAEAHKFPDMMVGFLQLSVGQNDRSAKWDGFVRTKKKRVRYFDRETHVTEFRMKGSSDPRMREDI